MLSDGLGYGNRVDSKVVKSVTTALLVFSTLLAVVLKTNPIQVIIVAQATTILGGPLVAIILLIMSNDKNVLGEDRNGIVANVIAVIAIAWICYLSINQLLSMLR